MLKTDSKIFLHKLLLTNTKGNVPKGGLLQAFLSKIATPFQPAITCSKLAIEISQQSVKKYVQS